MTDKTTSRIALMEPDTAPKNVQEIYQRFENNGMGILNVMKIFGNDVGFLAGFESMLNAIYADDTLAPRYRELAWLRTSTINECHY